MPDKERDTAGVLAPPPLIFLGFLIAGFAIDWFWPAMYLPQALQYVAGALLIAAALALALWAMGRFRRAGTHVEPYKPTTAVVSDGPYAYSRNPIYVGLFLLYAGTAVCADNAWLLPLAPALYLVMHHGVVRREERYLERKFGAAYLDYKARVRRWL
jgi:protein-S-isoprenylcysteine O-methyltransferase Ste14